MRQPLRISATAVDQFLKIGNPIHSFTDEIFTLEMWIDGVKAGWQPTAKMLFGTAFGAVITEPEKYFNVTHGCQDSYDIDVYGLKFKFDESQVGNGIELMAAYRPSMFWEQKTELKFGLNLLV